MATRPTKFKYTTIKVRTDVLKALAAAADKPEARTAMGVKIPGDGPLQGVSRLVQDGVILLTKEAQRVKCEEAKGTEQ